MQVSVTLSCVLFCSCSGVDGNSGDVWAEFKKGAVKDGNGGPAGRVNFEISTDSGTLLVALHEQ